MKCLWARVRESKKAKKKKKINTVTLHWEMCAFFHCLRNSNSVRWFTIAKCTCIHDSVLFFLFVCCVLFTAIITVFFSLNDNIDIAPCTRILFQPRFKLVCSKLNLAFSVNNIAVSNCSREIKKMAIMKSQYCLEILFQNYFRR